MSAAPIDEILWAWGPGESRFALCARGRLIDLLIDRPTVLSGSRFLGRVVARDPGLDAVFVDLGLEGRPGFLSGAGKLGLSEGDAVAVLVRAEARAGKGPLLTPLPDTVPPPSCRAPALLSRPEPLERLLAAYPEVRRVLADDPAALAVARRLAPDRAEGWRDGSVLSHHGVDAEIEALTLPTLPLAGGGRLTIESTAALTAIDVDSGGGRADQANRAAVAAIARQLRLRNLAGQIVVDFVSDRRGANPHRLAEKLREAVAEDPVPTHVFGASRLGLVELTRDRHGVALADLLSEPSSRPTAETVALAALRQVLAEAPHRPGRALTVILAAEVAAELSGRHRAARSETEARLGRPLTVRPSPGAARETILIEETPR